MLNLIRLTFRTIYFPIIVVLSTFLGIPIVLLRPFHPNNNFIFQKILNTIGFPFFGIDFQIEGQDLFNNRPSVVIGNHQHNFDVLMCTKSLLPRMLVIGKKELAYLPIFGQAFWLAGNIFINRGNRRSAMNSMNLLEDKLKNDKVSVVIFPEGHRNKSKKLLPFKKGAFYTAIHCQVPIICFSVSSYAQHLKLGNVISCKMHIKVHPAIETKGLTKDDIPMLIEKTREIIERGRDELDKKIGY
jgi:1-acyl-sn-glycerol-3-phosphate acyltransferase